MSSINITEATSNSIIFKTHPLLEIKTIKGSNLSNGKECPNVKKRLTKIFLFSIISFKY